MILNRLTYLGANFPHRLGLLSSKTTTKGMGLAESVGKEDYIKLGSSPTLSNFLRGVV
jgi:hypothetical protein